MEKKALSEVKIRLARIGLVVPIFLISAPLMILLLLLAFPFLVIFMFVCLTPAHTKNQPCPSCGKKAKFERETVLEGQGRRSWTDLIIADYTCPNGHHFSKEWTGSAWGD